MIIVEGPDGVGKTTLCKRLLTRLPQHIYAHFTRLPPAFDFFHMYLERMSRFVVQDRFHMSEVVYTAMRKEPANLLPETYRLIDAKLRLLGGYTVLVCASDAIIRGRYHDGQMYTLEQTLDAAHRFYDIGQGGSGMDIDYYYYCTTKDPHVPDPAVDDIIAGYTERQALLSRLAGVKQATLEGPGIYAVR